jgi:hypothetical protein
MSGLRESDWTCAASVKEFSKVAARAVALTKFEHDVQTNGRFDLHWTEFRPSRPP